jgi:hypothetical protein
MRRMKRAFGAFVLLACAASVWAQEQKPLVPSERLPTTHVTPPTVRIGSRIVITLSRGACFGRCPVYTVTITNLDIVFDGREFVSAVGNQTAKADPEAVRKLAEKFVASDFYSMDPEYRAPISDVATDTLSITIDGRRKVVTDYAGALAGMPKVITELEHDVDELGHTEQWIKGNE